MLGVAITQTTDAPAADIAWQRVLRLQRAKVIGFGNPEELDAAIVEWRHAHRIERTARPASHGTWPGDADELRDEPRVRFAGWLVEAATRASPALAS